MSSETLGDRDMNMERQNSPDPKPLDPVAMGNGDERARKRRSAVDNFSLPETMIFSAGVTWAKKLKPKNPREDVSLKSITSEELGKIKLIPSETISGLPRITTEDELLDAINKEWEQAIVIKLTGRPWNIEVLRGRFENLWNLCGNYELLDVGPSLYIIRKLDAVVRETILTKKSLENSGAIYVDPKMEP